MSTDTLDAAVRTLESRATAAEAALSQLEQQQRDGHANDKAATMMSGGGDGDSAALALRLRELLQCMHADRDECELIRAQRDELREENERLRLQVSKHEYRIKHLLRTVDEMEAKTTTAAAGATATASGAGDKKTTA